MVWDDISRASDFGKIASWRDAKPLFGLVFYHRCFSITASFPGCFLFQHWGHHYFVDGMAMMMVMVLCVHTDLKHTLELCSADSFYMSDIFWHCLLRIFWLQTLCVLITESRFCKSTVSFARGFSDVRGLDRWHTDNPDHPPGNHITDCTMKTSFIQPPLL